MKDREALRKRILSLLEARGPDKSICPSEAARELAPADWRSLMPEVRDLARAMAAEGLIEVMQRGRVVDPQQVKGPIRLKLRIP